MVDGISVNLTSLAPLRTAIFHCLSAVRTIQSFSRRRVIGLQRACAAIAPLTTTCPGCLPLLRSARSRLSRILIQGRPTTVIQPTLSVQLLSCLVCLDFLLPHPVGCILYMAVTGHICRPGLAFRLKLHWQGTISRLEAPCSRIPFARIILLTRLAIDGPLHFRSQVSLR